MTIETTVLVLAADEEDAQRHAQYDADIKSDAWDNASVFAHPATTLYGDEAESLPYFTDEVADEANIDRSVGQWVAALSEQAKRDREEAAMRARQVPLAGVL